MITKTDWRAVNEQLMADDRDRLEPPTAEEMLAYTRGELPAEEEARMRERLACHPELARSLAVPFPTAGAEPGDPDYVSDDEYAAHWTALQSRMRRAKRSGAGHAVPLWRTAFALAAVVAIVMGLGWRQAHLRAFEPRMVDKTESLLPDGRRGPTTPPDSVEVLGDSVLFVVQLMGPRDYGEYRIELIRAASNRTMWRSGPVRPREDGTFAILVPKKFVRPGEYRIAVYGIGGGAEQQIATYSVRVR